MGKIVARSSFCSPPFNGKNMPCLCDGFPDHPAGQSNEREKGKQREKQK
jgi:hypothetical protein